MSNHGGVRAGCVCPAFCAYAPWGVSVGWSAKVWSVMVLEARPGGGCSSERVSAVRIVVVSRGVGVRRATDYICMFGILYFLVAAVSLVM